MVDWSTEPLVANLRWKNAGASEIAIAEMLAALGTPLPEDYLALMRFTNGAEGLIGSEGYIQLWTVEDLVEDNVGYGVPEFAPGLVVIATNLGGTAYGIDTRWGDASTMEYVQTELIGMGWDGIFYRGRTLYDLLWHIGYER